MNRVSEKLYPYVTAVAAAVLAWRYGPAFPTGTRSEPLFTAVLTIASITVGFLATAKSIILGLDSRPIRKLKTGSAYGDLIGYLIAACNHSLFLAGATSLWMFFDVSPGTTIADRFFAVWLGVVVLATLSCHRVLTIFAKLLLAGVPKIAPAPSGAAADGEASNDET